MKLFHKLFLCFVVLFSVLLQIAGALILDRSWENGLEQEKRYALSEFQYNKYILQSMLYQEPDLFYLKEGFRYAKDDFTVKCGIFDESNKCLFSNLSVDADRLDLDAAEAAVSYEIQKDQDECRIFLYQTVEEGGAPLCFVTETDISRLVENERRLTDDFQKIFLALLAVGSFITFWMSSFFTRPIKRISRGARRIAGGDLQERLPAGSRDEVGELARNFNYMAGQIEEKIAQLADTARQKDDFTANFAHELKTPMTSVIGYADMLYQKDLSREQVKDLAEYILNEGMRLESLSLKLMDLFVLEKQDFRLERMEAADIFREAEPGLRPICEKGGAELSIEAEDGALAVDYDLFKTMLLNLVDNGVKADGKHIKIRGEARDGVYQISVSDDGKGIPKEEQSRITEAFYMVDKSRARRQHGAGLGMTLIQKILEIHHGELAIESDGKTGTNVRLTLPVWENGASRAEKEGESGL